MQIHIQYTRCPQCHTAFKVTEKMLAMAHGKVRCGACLQVFQATDYLLQPRAQTSDATSQSIPGQEPFAESPVEMTQPSVNEESVEQAFLKESIEEQTIEETTAQGELDNHHVEPNFGDIDDATADLDESISAEFQNESGEEVLAEPDDLSFEQADYADQMTDEFNLEAEELNQQETVVSAEPDFVEPRWSGEDDDAVEASVLELDDDFISAIEAKIETPLNDEMEEPQGRDEPLLSDLDVSIAMDEPEIAGDDEEIAQTKLTESFAVEEYAEIDSDNLDLMDEETDLPEFEEEYAAHLAIDESLDSERLALSEPDELELLADNLAEQINDSDTQPDPLEEFEGRVERKKTTLRTLVIVSVLLVLVALLGNNFWQNRQTLAWDDTWGGMTLSLCKFLPCDLKPRRDVSKIRLRQRIVTPSETQENYLDVKILLTNEADFAQPYPRITIKYSNSLGEPVAEQHFEVADYFPEKQSQLMPSGSEVHIAFVTKQPHPDALGFEFAFD